MRGEVFVVDDPFQDTFKSERRHRALGRIDECIVIGDAPGKAVELPLQRAAGVTAGLMRAASIPE